MPISNSWYPAVGGTTISSSDWQAQISDLASTLTASIANDGQTPILANLPMSGFKHTGAAAGTAATDYALLGQVQANQAGWVVATGTADAITATYSPAMASLTDGMLLAFRASAANATTTPTFAPNGLTAHTITRGGGTALSIGDIPGNLAECLIRYNLANTRWELLNPVGGLEGTFTPGVTFGGASVGMTFSQQVGTYIKIGRLVFISAAFTFTAKGSSTGTFLLTGLPFASLNGNAFGGINIWSYLNLNSITSIFGNVTRNDTTIGLSNFGAANSTALDNTAFNNSSSIVLSATYYAAS